jgi:voltage-gated potassium channel
MSTDGATARAAQPGPGLAVGVLAAERTTRSDPYQLFMLVLCLFALGALAVEAVVAVDPQTRGILARVDTVVCFVFFVDFIVSLVRAPKRWQYFYRWGWIDLLSSIPAVEVLRWGRAARVLRILRVLRGMKAARTIAQFLVDRRAEGAGLAAGLLTLLLVASTSIAVLHFEKDFPGSNIRSPDDSIWWSFATITTVGYGDKYPVSSEGRVVGIILMTAGVGMFATLSGLIAAWFLAPRAAARDRELAALHEELRELRRLLDARGKG